MSMMNKPVGIIGTGSFLPDNVVTNFDLEKWSIQVTNGSENVQALKKDALHQKV